MIRTNNFTLVILLVIFISASCASDSEQFEWEEGKVVISGKLVSLERHPYRTINFRFADLLTRERIYTAEIEEDGGFRTDASVLYPQDFTTDFGYGYLTTHIVCP